jgi:hypothetical protein
LRHCYRPGEEWYKGSTCCENVKAYYEELRDILHGTSKKHRVLKRCRHCGILFLTHPGNRNREDIGCPFGCREHELAKKSNERVSEYYKSDAGKMKKKKLNQKRHLKNQAEDMSKEKSYKTGEDDFMDYMSWMVGLTEGRKVSKEEVKELLKEMETTPPVQEEKSG